MIVKRPSVAGDSVWLASGSPRMSVVYVGIEVKTIWPDENGDMCYGTYVDACLSPVDPAKYPNFEAEWIDRLMVKS